VNNRRKTWPGPFRRDSCPQAVPAWTELKAAYRFFGQAGVSFQQILTPYLEPHAGELPSPVNI